MRLWRWSDVPPGEAEGGRRRVRVHPHACCEEHCEILIGRRNRYGTRKVFVKYWDIEISESRARVTVDDGGMTILADRGEYFIQSDMFDCKASDLGMFCMGE